MPRRPDEVLSKIPLFLIPPAIRQGIMKAGEEVERILVKKVNRHYYNISIRTRPVKRELFGRHGKAGYPETWPVGIDGGGT